MGYRRDWICYASRLAFLEYLGVPIEKIGDPVYRPDGSRWGMRPHYLRLV